MTEEWLKVESVAHKAVITVDRNGTEAAAVTHAVMLWGCPPDSFKKKRKMVRLNRPFLFAIMHNETELPVFVGILNCIDGNGLEEE
jgi:serpin B